MNLIGMIMEKNKITMVRLEELFKEVTEEVRGVGIPVSARIVGPVINTRAKARFGCCKAGKKTIGPVSYTIEISSAVLAADEKFIKEIIAHELLHTCKGCMNHGKKWKQYTETLHAAYGYNITRTSTYESLGLERPESASSSGQPQGYKYRLVCQNCGGEILRKKMCKVVANPGNYRCGKCGGHLKLESKNTTSCR